jgi:peptide/nickel transport system substrate-binding protein
VTLDHSRRIEELDSFRTRFPSRYHVSPEQATVLVFLNVTKPPFDDVRVRRALNYAIDRSAISASYAPGLARPTCQPRPPGTVGFRRYCPYTAAPSPTGEWKAPDLARARRLVEASGTRGMNVTVWTYPGFWEAGARGAVRALRALGYRASISRATDLDDYIATASNPRTRGVQAGMIGWYGVPRAAASVLPLFKCRPPDLSFFCDRRVDARIARYLEMEADDADAAAGLWTGLERDIVDLAPWVPLFTPSHAHLLSERVGNYQLNPELRVLFDQLWVR